MGGGLAGMPKQLLATAATSAAVSFRPTHKCPPPRQGRTAAVFQTPEARLLRRNKEESRKRRTNVLFADRVGPNRSVWGRTRG